MFGRWTVLGPREVRRGIPIWRCHCACGKEKWVVSQTLKNGSSRSCGCLCREQTVQRFLKNLAGKRFGRLTVLDKRKSERRVNFWLCRCDCGMTLSVRAVGLQQGSSRSCGCLNRELSSQRARLLKKRHRVFLTEADRQRLREKGDVDSQILLLCDESQNAPALTDKQISERLHLTRTKVEYVRTKFSAPRELRRRALFALQQMTRDPRRRQLRVESRRRYDAKPSSKAKKAAYRNDMPAHVRKRRRLYRQAYKQRPEVRLRENERERAWRRTPEGKQRKRMYVERGKARSNARYRERCRTEVAFRIRHALRARLRLALKHKGIREPRSTLQLVGCTPNELRLCLERKFLPGMTWANHGKWHIDHIIPCAHFDLTDPEARKRCFHFSNLQPLWASENVRKGRSLKEAGKQF
jgi:hypothetical protein